jgi:hypothetical protein
MEKFYGNPIIGVWFNGRDLYLFPSQLDKAEADGIIQFHSHKIGEKDVLWPHDQMNEDSELVPLIYDTEM